jgi:hypothetical protein
VTLVVVVIAVALICSSETVRRAIPSESVVVGGLLTISLALLFQMGRLG